VVVGQLALLATNGLVVRRRVRALRAPRARAARRRPAAAVDVVCRVPRALVARRRRLRRRDEIDAEVPVLLDLLVVALASGVSIAHALELTAPWAPPGVASIARRSSCVATVDGAAAVGGPMVDSQVPGLVRLGRLLADSARQGSPVGAALERLAADLRVDRRRRAEARARTVSVRMLFPLVFLVLPAFGLLTVVPALDAGLRGG
jgi:tight adherence protein C